MWLIWLGCAVASRDLSRFVINHMTDRRLIAAVVNHNSLGVSLK
jgi:hypothetical protein